MWITDRRDTRRESGKVRRAMVVCADILCYLCGHIAGWVKGAYATLSRTHLLHPNTDVETRTIRTNGSMRCGRYDDLVFFEGAAPIRIRHRRRMTAMDVAGVAATA